MPYVCYEQSLIILANVSEVQTNKQSLLENVLHKVMLMNLHLYIMVNSISHCNQSVPFTPQFTCQQHEIQRITRFWKVMKSKENIMINVNDWLRPREAAFLSPTSSIAWLMSHTVTWLSPTVSLLDLECRTKSMNLNAISPKTRFTHARNDTCGLATTLHCYSWYLSSLFYLPSIPVCYPNPLNWSPSKFSWRSGGTLWAPRGLG